MKYAERTFRKGNGGMDMTTKKMRKYSIPCLLLMLAMMFGVFATNVLPVSAAEDTEAVETVDGEETDGTEAEGATELSEEENGMLFVVLGGGLIIIIAVVVTVVSSVVSSVAASDDDETKL